MARPPTLDSDDLADEWNEVLEDEKKQLEKAEEDLEMLQSDFYSDTAKKEEVEKLLRTP
jgi:hypothetical protein